MKVKALILLSFCGLLSACGGSSGGSSGDSKHCSDENIVEVREQEQWRNFTFQVNNCNDITYTAIHYVFTDLPNRVTYNDGVSEWYLSRSSSNLGTLTNTDPSDGVTYVYKWSSEFEEFSKTDNDGYFEWIHSEHQEYSKVYTMYFDFEELHNEAMKNATKV
ncbi:hypothetical protein [Vibrio hibernica]|uniref:hypothetical protein n=1 Tax=Vibrio hibernica TaxID=2587465 RepID=UPI00187E7CB7|nr:hypothetical protein [Vibrio hibernica]